MHCMNDVGNHAVLQYFVHFYSNYTAHTVFEFSIEWKCKDMEDKGECLQIYSTRDDAIINMVLANKANRI